MSSSGQEPKPLTVRNAISSDGPFYLRKIIRPTPWHAALESGNAESVRTFFFEPDGSVSLWLIQNDLDFRRVAIAINEGRDSFRERITFLAIFPAELRTLDVELHQTDGATLCEAAKELHFDAKVSEEASARIAELLLQSQRRVSNCTQGQMARALAESENDGCFAVVEDSVACICGAARNPAAN